jgi:hypothetical protein
VTDPAGTADTDLTGTRALIIGRTSGIGLAMAAALAQGPHTPGPPTSKPASQAVQPGSW